MHELRKHSKITIVGDEFVVYLGCKEYLIPKGLYYLLDPGTLFQSDPNILEEFMTHCQCLTHAYLGIFTISVDLRTRGAYDFTVLAWETIWPAGNVPIYHDDETLGELGTVPTETGFLVLAPKGLIDLLSLNLSFTGFPLLLTADSQVWRKDKLAGNLQVGPYSILTNDGFDILSSYKFQRNHIRVEDKFIDILNGC